MIYIDLGYSITNYKTIFETLMEVELGLYESGEKTTNVSTQFNPSILENALSKIKVIGTTEFHEVVKKLGLSNYKITENGVPKTVRSYRTIENVGAMEVARLLDKSINEDRLHDYLDSQY